MTPKQRDILNYFERCQIIFGFPPTVQEVADQFGIAKPTAYGHCEALFRKGLLVADKARTARRFSLPNRCPTCGNTLTERTER